MKRTVVVLFALLLLAGAAVASPVCVKAGLNVYIANYNTADLNNSCQIGDKIFYDFSFDSSLGQSLGPVPGPNPDEVGVNPDPGNGTTNPGLFFSSFSFLAYGGDTLDATIRYSVATVSGSSLIEDYTLEIAGAYIPLIEGLPALGPGIVTESFSNPELSLLNQVGLGGTTVVAHVGFTPFVSGTTVTTNIHMSLPASDEGYLTISAIREHFSEQIPEPYATVLIGSGLCFLGLRRKRVKR
jgi:hypothetical protein